MFKLSQPSRLRLAGAAIICAAYAALTACSSADSDLARFLEDTKKVPGGRVEPLPEIEPSETFKYAAAGMRSPFLPSSPGAGDVRPESKRNREFLEEFPLDTLKMVGTLHLGGQIYGLVQTKDGIVHRVTVGNHMGQADGKITVITPSKISLVEIVQGGPGSYMERPAALALNE